MIGESSGVNKYSRMRRSDTLSAIIFLVAVNHWALSNIGTFILIENIHLELVGRLYWIVIRSKLIIYSMAEVIAAHFCLYEALRPSFTFFFIVLDYSRPILYLSEVIEIALMSSTSEIFSILVLSFVMTDFQVTFLKLVLPLSIQEDGLGIVYTIG